MEMILVQFAGLGLYDLIGGIAASVGAFFAIRKFYKFIRKWAIQILEDMSGVTGLKNEVNKLGELIRQGNEKMNTIISEFKPNGGHNTTDKLNIIISNQSRTDARFSALLSESNVCLFETNEDGEITSVNTKLCRLTGRNTDELLGNGWFNTILSSERDAVTREWENCVVEKRSLETEFTLVDVHGHHIPVALTLKKMGVAPNNSYGYFGSINQITK